MISLLGHIPKIIEVKILKRYLSSRVHFSTPHSSQVLEATQVSIDKLMDKKSGVCI